MKPSSEIRFHKTAAYARRAAPTPAEQVAITVAASARSRRGVRPAVVVTMVWNDGGRSRFIVVGRGASLSGGASTAAGAAPSTGPAANG